MLKTAKGNMKSCKLTVSCRRGEVWWCGARARVGFCGVWIDVETGWGNNKFCIVCGIVDCKDCGRSADG